jgi:hypothetical protein
MAGEERGEEVVREWEPHRRRIGETLDEEVGREGGIVVV